MNPLYLVTLLALGAAASDYGQATVRVEPAYSSYSAPAPQRATYSSGYSNNYESQPIRQHVPILRFDQTIQGGHANAVHFETGNGISSSFNTQVVRGRPSEYMDENGHMVQTDSSITQSGHSYHEIDGRHISLNWEADENGFRATGDHLPQPVPLPAEHAEAHRLALARDSSSYGNSYSAPVLRQEPYSAPAPVIRQSYSAPAPAPVLRSSY